MLTTVTVCIGSTYVPIPTCPPVFTLTVLPLPFRLRLTRVVPQEVSKERSTGDPGSIEHSPAEVARNCAEAL